MDQILALSPSEELEFQQPPTGPAFSVLRLRNISTRNAIYKVKITTPDLYIVKPNQGLLKLGEEVHVNISIKGEPPLTLAKQKFQILATTTTLTQVPDIPAALKGTDVSMHVLGARFGSEARVSTSVPAPVGPDLRQYREQLLAEKSFLEKQVASLQEEARKTSSQGDVSADAEASKGYSFLHLCIVLILGLIIGSSFLGR